MTPTALEPGQIWREVAIGRLVRITDRTRETVATWTYCDDAGNPVPHGREPANGIDYPDWYTHRCDVWDFFVWGRFEFVRDTATP